MSLDALTKETARLLPDMAEALRIVHKVASDDAFSVPARYIAISGMREEAAVALNQLSHDTRAEPVPDLVIGVQVATKLLRGIATYPDVIARAAVLADIALILAPLLDEATTAAELERAKLDGLH